MDEGLPTQYILVEGKVFYITPDGDEETWMYKADKDGFRLLIPKLVQANRNLSNRILVSIICSFKL